MYETVINLENKNKLCIGIKKYIKINNKANDIYFKKKKKKTQLLIFYFIFIKNNII